MYIDKMMKMFMAFISYQLEKGWKFRIIDKQVDGKLILDDYGFCVIINNKKIYVSPEYVIDLFVKSYSNNQSDYIYMSYESLYDISHKISLETVNNNPSWTRIMYYISKIQNNIVEQNNKIMNIDYYCLKQYLNSLNPPFFKSIVNEIKNLSYKGLSYMVLNKKFEALYSLELLMTQYFMEEIQNEINDKIIDRVGSEIDLSDYQTDISTMFKILKLKNDSKIIEKDIEWLKYKYNNQNEKKLTKNPTVLPASLEVTVAYQKFNDAKKADYC